MSSTKRTKTSQNETIFATSYSTPSSCNSAEIIGCNDDLLNQILLCLPIKSLIKFKSVSKHWFSLISNPEFSRRRNPFPDPISGLFLKRSSKLIRSSRQEFDFVDLNHTSESKSNPPFTSLSSGIGIIQSCNGLLLCSKALDNKKVKYYIYNPTTKKYTKLPQLPIRNGSNKIYGASLAFDPSKSPHHKVVCIRNSVIEADNFQIETYSSETGSWRLSHCSFYVDIWNTRTNGGVYWNGSVHWISLWEHSLYFNVDEERLSRMPMPPVPDGWDGEKEQRYFGESRGHLHLIEHINEPHLDVYEMEMDYSCWFVKFRVDLSELRIAFPRMIRRNKFKPANLHEYVFSVLCIVRSELDEDSYLVLKIRGEVIRYNFKTSTFYKLCDVDPGLPRTNKAFRICNFVSVMFPEVSYEWYHVHQYIESLALV